MAGELPLKLALKPLPSLMVLTHWAVSITAGAEHFVGFTTVLTTEDDQATG